MKNRGRNGILVAAEHRGKVVFWLFLQKLQRFMMGRYGGDALNLVLLVLGLLCSLFSRLFWPLILLGDALYLYALFRILSRNIPARQREYYAFLKVWGPLSAWVRRQREQLSLRRTYKYFRCPNCKQRLRAPRGRGKIEVTCQKCHQVFRTKT